MKQCFLVYRPLCLAVDEPEHRCPQARHHLASMVGFDHGLRKLDGVQRLTDEIVRARTVVGNLAFAEQQGYRFYEE
ncbi:hypothetical protein Xoosp14_119 [Xanthomonas phage Xoo-sp14]|nr:hypothetical protein Xoosp14_119 [Xanthomonas phage Xoo-sp14]